MVKKQRRKRPITDAVLHAEATYRRVRRKIATLATEIGDLRAEVDENEERLKRIILEPPILQELEDDMIRHREELEQLERDYKSSKAIVQEKIKEKLVLHQGFVHFLSGFLLHEKKKEKDTSQCLLVMLDLGHETTCSIKQRIADFAGVPLGDDLLSDLRQAYTSLGGECKEGVCRKDLWDPFAA